MPIRYNSLLPFQIFEYRNGKLEVEDINREQQSISVIMNEPEYRPGIDEIQTDPINIIAYHPSIIGICYYNNIVFAVSNDGTVTAYSYYDGVFRLLGVVSKIKLPSLNIIKIGLIKIRVSQYEVIYFDKVNRTAFTHESFLHLPDFIYSQQYDENKIDMSKAFSLAVSMGTRVLYKEGAGIIAC